MNQSPLPPDRRKDPQVHGFGDFVTANSGFAVTVFSILVLAGLALAAVIALPGNVGGNAKTTATIVSGATTAIGTIVGLYVGNRFGSLGRKAAEDERKATQRHLEAELVRTQILASNLAPEKAADVNAQVESAVAARRLD